MRKMAMDSMDRGSIGRWALAVALASAGVALGQTDGAPPATAAAAVAATAPATKPSVDELLAARKPAPFDFSAAPMIDVMDYVSRSYDLDIVNNYPLTDRVTMQFAHLSAREAINILDSSILPLGYTLIESVRGDPARVVLTVAPTKLDAGRLMPVFYGNDPDQIPEGEAQRTQVMTLKAVDPQKAHDTLVAVLGKQAEITINPSNKTIIIADTSTHVHMAAALLQMLEKQAADNK
jgi:type II secretory pathway component GspD/PulD (secretin)